VQLFRENADLCGRYGDIFRYLLIDEYQDTNPPQYELIRLLTVAHQNLSAVGDEDQAIYGFRGADITNILRFEADFPGAQVIKLEQNYRSCQTILSAATAVVSNNLNRKDKVLWTDLPKGEPITVFVADDAASEAAFVAQQTYLHRQDGVRSVAVLYRTNFQSRQFEEAFRRLSIPYKLVGGVSFYHRREVRDAMAYLRVVLNPGDDVSLGRILNQPPRGIGERTRSRLLRTSSDQSIPIWEAILKSLADQEFPGRAHRALQDFVDMIEACFEMRELPLHLALEKILKKVGYLKWLEDDGSEEASNRILNLKELMNVAREYEGAESWQQFLDEAALHTELDEVDESADVTLMTLHNAKGLEFPVVFLAGCEEGLFPHSRSIAENDLEEERRLCYVGLTRARQRLYLSYSRHRRFFGRESNEINQPSRFLHEIPSELIENRYSQSFHGSRSYAAPVSLQASSLSVPAKPRSNYSGKTYNSPDSIRQALSKRAPKKGSGGLQKGTLIVHERFGKGQVLAVESTGDDLKVTVRFPGLGVKKLLQSYAKLKPA
jgi:DNA helicase-2/ATP-dependent DNA helicase PcrA